MNLGMQAFELAFFATCTYSDWISYLNEILFLKCYLYVYSSKKKFFIYIVCTLFVHFADISLHFLRQCTNHTIPGYLFLLYHQFLLPVIKKKYISSNEAVL